MGKQYGKIGGRRGIILSGLFLVVAVLINSVMAVPKAKYSLSNDYFSVETGQYGEISSLKLTGDSYNTNYVMNAANSPKQDTADHQWLGELMFTYRLGSGAWKTALTNQSGDVRKQSKSGNTVTVTYQNSSNSKGIKNFQLTESYSLVDDYLYWEIKVKNTGAHNLEIGDFGLPLPFNERWPGTEAIYETRTVDHSFTGNNSSYIYVTRPSGIGPFLLLTPDASTGAGFEYQDHWRIEEHSGSTWCQDQGDWANGLNVFYIHSSVIKSTGRGYLANTSLKLTPNQEKVYAFKFHKVADLDAMKAKLYQEGLIDVNVVPGMIVPTDQIAKFDLHTSKTINSITPQYPSETTVTYLNTVAPDHRIYQVQFQKLGQNNLTVDYGDGERTVLQFYVIEPIAAALQRHATFMVEKTQWNDASKGYNKVFDDWMMDTKAKRGEFYGYWGWGDDWGYTHGQFLAEKNFLNPVASEIAALDEYLEIAIWKTLMSGHHEDYLIHDFYKEEPNDTPTYRGYAYPHIYNTFFSMYKIAKLYPGITTFKNERTTYLLRAYHIFKALYDGAGVCYNWSTGLMGESTTPEIIQALKDEGYTNQAADITNKMKTKYNNFKNTTYPYGSEYSYDNTGEEAVYMLAKMYGNTTMMSKINQKTRACRGTQPVWYYYADPVTICGENWWNFQYTTSLAGYCMDDWMRYYSTTPEEDARLAYAAKIANISCINSGQIDADSANIGAVSWTYQAEKGNLGGQGVGGGKLHNGWRQMSGEADLGLFGAIRILSADVADDPIFGLYGYGCAVTVNGSNYQITPKDGICKRLNLLTQKFYLELDRDRYTSATISTNKNYVQLTLENQYVKAAHTTKISLTGLAAGTYNVFINDSKVGTATATNGQKTVVGLSIGTAATYDVKITAGSGNTTMNTAPTVDAGADKTVSLPSSITLSGTVGDDDLPAGATVNTAWSLQSGPGSAVIADVNALRTTVTVDTAGTYVFKLTASDGELSAADTVSVAVKTASTPDDSSTAGCSIKYTTYDWGSGATVCVTIKNNNTTAIEDWKLTWNFSDNQKITTLWCGGYTQSGTAVTVEHTRYNGTIAANGGTVSFGFNLTYSGSNAKPTNFSLTAANGGGTGATNTAPTVEAGAAASFILPAKVTLSGTASDDGLPSGSTLTTTWSLKSGPDTVTFTDAHALSTTATVTTAGTYVFLLTATDGALAASDTVTITVNAAASESTNPNSPVVTAPPAGEFDSFYKKCVYSYNIPILASNNVSDAALIKAYWILDAMLKKMYVDRQDIYQQLIKSGVYVDILGLNEYNYQLPSWGSYYDRTLRRAGGSRTATTLEEELIVASNNTYLQSFCVLVHEFTHTILMMGIGDDNVRGVDSALFKKIKTCYNNAVANNLYTESSYDRTNVHEYFAGQVPRWFNSNPTNLNVPNASQLTDRQQLEIYDPDIYAIITGLFGDYKLPEPFN
jgi:hypothetical protein